MTNNADATVLINGATGGLGPAVARFFAASGANLVLSARQQDALDELAAELQRELTAGLNLPAKGLLVQPADALDPQSLAEQVRAAHRRFGAIDVMVHITGGFAMGAADQMTPQEWAKMMDLNLNSAFYAANAVLPGMLERGSGKLIFVSSRNGSQPAAQLSAYAASKSGLDMLVRSLAEETRRKGINVNAVAPSVIDTPANRASNPKGDYSNWVTPASIAEVIGFLASAAARDVHGAIIPVYGRA